MPLLSTLITLGSMIRALPPRSKQKWPQILQTLTFAYNCTAHESTGYAPFYLMYGRTPRLPVDVMFHSVERDCDVADCDKYVCRLREDLREALSSAQVHAITSQKHQAKVYNRKAKGHKTVEGDQVLLANKGEKGCRTLADKWESVPYVVISRDLKCHTYWIKNTSTGQERLSFVISFCVLISCHLSWRRKTTSRCTHGQLSQAVAECKVRRQTQYQGTSHQTEQPIGC